MLFLRLSFRNLFRNYRRSGLTALVIAVGLGAVIFTDAFVKGMARNLVQSATHSFLGQAQIHAEGYRQARAVEKVIHNSQALLEKLAHDRSIQRFTLRVQAVGMLSSAGEVQSVFLNGIDPKTEAQLSPIKRAIRQGSYFTAGKRQILIGETLAKNLNVQLGDRLVLTLAQAHSGELSQEMFRVQGIFRFGSKQLDKQVALIKRPKAQELLGIGSGFHEVALQFRQAAPTQEEFAQFEARYSQAGQNEALGWPKLIPEFLGVIKMLDYSTSVILLIVFAIVALSVMNCLFMAFYERIFEFAVLRAVGTRPRQMMLLVLEEAAWLAFFGVTAGLLLGGGVSLLTAHLGIDYGGLQMQGVTLQDKVYPVFTWAQYTVYPLLFFGFSLLVALYPALHTARLQPATAMKQAA